MSARAVERIQYDPVHGSGGSPELHKGHLLINCDGKSDPFVVSLDADNGEETWRVSRPETEDRTFSFSTPLVVDADGREQLISAGSHIVCSYDPATGELLWYVRYPNKWSIVPRPVFAGGLVFVCTGYEGAGRIARDSSQWSWRRYRISCGLACRSICAA